MDFEAKIGACVVKLVESNASFDSIIEEINKINGSKKFVIQIFDPSILINKNHLLVAYVNSMIVFNDKKNKTSSLAMEMLLFASMSNQINKAIDIAGAKEGSDFVLFSSSIEAIKLFSKKVKIKIKEFNPTKKEIEKVAKNLGLDNKKNFDLQIFQKMVLSRINAD